MSSASAVRRGAMLALALLAVPARAQEMGLDLSDSGPDLRPTLAILGIAAEGADAGDHAHAARLSGALVAASRKTGWFARVLDPAEVQAALGDKAEEASRCEAAPCLAEAARALGVDRVLAAQMTFPSDGPALALHGYDAGSEQVEQSSIDAGGRPQGFDRKVAMAFKPFLQALSTALGTLKVVPSVPGARVEVLGRDLGTGTVERPVPAGTLRVRVTAADHAPFEGSVTVPSRGHAELQAPLASGAAVASGSPLRPDFEPVDVSTSAPGKPFYARPGLYLAVAGVAAAAVGVLFGVKAKGVQNRAKDDDGDGVLDVTRAETKSAATQATLFNVLVPVGAAAAVGGVVWFALEPAPAGPKSRSPGHEPGMGSEPVAFNGVVFTARGEF